MGLARLRRRAGEGDGDDLQFLVHINGGWAAGSGPVGEASDARPGEALAPGDHGLAGAAEQLSDLAVGNAVGSKGDDPGALGKPGRERG
jgi:hypothetical protein